MGRILGKKEEDILVPEVAATPAPERSAGGGGVVPPVSASSAVSMIDVESNLTAMAAENPDELDWKRSIVDLLKLVRMDSSYGARKEIALELGYTQARIDSKGSAEMNMWLHKEIMKRLTENGGKVPADLLD